MNERTTPNRRQSQDATQNLSQNPVLRKPPTAGGPTRAAEEPAQAPAQGPGVIKRTMPYWLPAITTGTGVAFGTYLLLS